jgi:LmeA-like phospholipid-binding
MSPVVEAPPSKRRGRRALVVVVVVAIVLVAAFFVADYFVKRFATDYVRDQVASSLGLTSTAPVRVDLGQGSILLQAATGHIDDVIVTVDPLVLGGLAGSATLRAKDVPLSKTKPIPSLDVTVFVPTTTLTKAIARVPSLSQLKPVVTTKGQNVEVTGTFRVFGLPQTIGVTLTPKVTKGQPTFVVDAATFDGASVSVSVLDRYLPGLSSVLQSGTTLCIADKLPAAFTLTDIQVRGDSIVSTFSGDGAELNAASLSQKGSCPGS